MSNTQTHRSDHAICKASASTSTCIGAIPKLITACVALLSLALLASSARAQTIDFSAGPPFLVGNLYVGGGYTGSYTNLQFKTTLSGTFPPVVLTPSVLPGGVTLTFSTNNLQGTCTNQITVAVANVAAGVYPITITGVTNAVQFGTASTTFNLVVGNLWTNLSQVTVPTATPVLWSTAANWSSGAAPGSTDNVMIQDAGGNTNFVDATTTIGSLSYIRTTGSSNFFTTIANGQTLAIAGANGFNLNEDTITAPPFNKGMTVRLAGFGGASLVVTNPSANYAVNGASSGTIGVNSGTSLTMTNLDKLYVSVNRVGFGDATTVDRGSLLSELVFVELAKTNVFISSYSNSFGGVNFTNSIQCFNHFDIGNGGFSSGNPMTLNLGISNIFLADSFRAGGNAVQSGNNTVKFAVVFTNGPVPVAYFRSTNGGRMSFFGAAVQSGAIVNNRQSKVILAFNQGILDLKVDTMWLGANRTNDSSAGNSGNQAVATLSFGGTTSPTVTSVVDVNTLIAGNQVFSNNAFCVGNIIVQTNAALVVNNYLEMGHTTGDTNLGALGLAAARGFGNLTINGGTAKINRINVGDLSTNNQVVLGIGGHLIISNTIASSAKSLTTLSVNGAKITLLVTSGVTNVFVTNLVQNLVGAQSPTLVNIASLSGFSPTVPATNVIIACQNNSANLLIGSLPPGFNNITLVPTPTTWELRIATNAPAVLKWRGGENSNWDHTSLNWLNTNTLAITRFFDGDSVIFDDSAVVPTTISVTEAIIPGQVGTGIFVSNSVNAFIFNDGGGSFGSCSLVKIGTNTLQMNAVGTGISAQINTGKLTGSGSLTGVTIASGTSMDFAGTINGVLTVAGNAKLTVGGIANNNVNVQNGGVMTNTGTIQGGGLTVNSNGFVFNATGGTLLSIGNANAVNVAIGATLINEGNIGAENQANSLTVNGTFKDLGLGNIYLTTFTLGGTFLPGGDAIGTTEIKSALVGSSFPGRITLLAGSTTLIKVNFASSPQSNTVVVAQFTDFGGNTAVKAFDGGTVLFTNINTGAGVFGVGQSFRAFTGPSGVDIGNEGLNTTNRYPIVNPIIPAANTKWDLANLRDTSPNGIINITGFPTTGTNLVLTTFMDSGNVVTCLQWPEEYIGWKLQQQTNSLSVGLSTNWITITGSTSTNVICITNSAAIDASFFRMIYP